MYPTLSEAIILGSLETEQAYYVYSKGGKTCALGAAWSAIDGLAFGGNELRHIPLQWKWAFESCYTCPKCNTRHWNAVVVIAHMNDEHKLSRPRIAQWVAEQEALLTQSPVPTQEVCLNESRS